MSTARQQHGPAQDEIDSLLARGDQCAARGEFRQALRCYFDALERAPQQPPLLERLAHTLYAAGQPREARCYFAALAPQHLDDEPFQTTYVNCLRAAHDPLAARAHLEALVAARPQSERYRMLLAEVLSDLGDPARAAAVLLDGLGEAAMGAAYYTLLGTLFAEAGEHEAAVEAFRAALVVDPDGPEAAAAAQALALTERVTEDV